MGRYFGREPRYSRQEIELQAKQAIEARVSMGRPPPEDFLPIEARLAQRDRDAARPAAPPTWPTDEHRPLTVTEVRLPAEARAVRPRRATPAGAGAVASPIPGGARRAVAAKER